MWVLPRVHGQVSEAFLLLLLHRHFSALSRIMPAFDVVKNIRSGRGSRPVLPSVPPFSFEHVKEIFGCRIVGTTPNRAHAAREVVGR